MPGPNKVRGLRPEYTSRFAPEHSPIVNSHLCPSLTTASKFSALGFQKFPQKIWSWSFIWKKEKYKMFIILFTFHCSTECWVSTVHSPCPLSSMSLPSYCNDCSPDRKGKRGCYLSFNCIRFQISPQITCVNGHFLTPRICDSSCCCCVTKKTANTLSNG